MSRTHVGIEQARKTLGDLVTAAQQGADIILTRNGKPAARIVAIQEDTMTTLTAEITELDAWGKPRTVRVAWVPEDVTAIVDPSRLNKRSAGRLIAHETTDKPPVALVRDAFGGLRLRTVVESWRGEYQHATEFSRVDTADELEPGSYCIVSDTEG